MLRLAADLSIQLHDDKALSHIDKLGMIFGIGTDIVSTRRIAKVWQRHGQAFARRILAEEEWAAFDQAHQPVHFLAKRFATKEAFSKAVGTGMRSPVTWHNIRVWHDTLGRPRLGFSAELESFLAVRAIQHVHLSISDEQDMAAAFVILEQ